MPSPQLEGIRKVVLAALDECGLEDNVLVTVQFCDDKGQVPKTVTKADALIQKALSREIPLIKTDEERYVLGVVLEPLKEMGKADKQNDTYSAQEVREAAYKFMEGYGSLGLQHTINITGRVKLVENAITRVDEKLGGRTVKAGTWLMGIRVIDDDLWKKVKDGSLTGFSIGGVAQRTPVE